MQHQELLLAALGRATSAIQRLDLAFDTDPYWLDRERAGACEARPLYAALNVTGVEVAAVISQQPLSDARSLAELASIAQSPLLALNAPMRLLPIVIQKAWGRELWYTGIEARGCSRVSDGRYSLALPDLLSLAPDYLCQGRGHSLVLLKVLDPHCEALLGDLYFEMHEQKREVCVVTHVDRRAWPDGRGAIRFGMNQKLRKGPGGEARLRAGYVEAVGRYEVVRRRIDALLDLRRASLGIDEGATVAPETTRDWLADVPKALRDEEEKLRAAMHRFTQLRRLEVGDVVAVPTLTPHALQHGVRVVEFQTPVYERRILSFSQKVLTQPHWDTAAAAALMRLDAPRTEVEVLHDTPDVRVERIVDFPEFQVQRVRLARHARLTLPEAAYALCLGLEGTTTVGALQLALEEAAFIPHPAMQHQLINCEDHDAVCLVALPV